MNDRVIEDLSNQCHKEIEIKVRSINMTVIVVFLAQKREELLAVAPGADAACLPPACRAPTSATHLHNEW